MASNIKPKRILDTAILGERGVNLVERLVYEMGFLFYRTGAVEAGIDAFIELRDQSTGQVAAKIVAVQVRATESLFLHEKENSFDYLCPERDLQYWLGGNMPIILVVCRPSSNEAYWTFVKSSFPEGIGSDRHIRFNKRRDQFGIQAAGRIAEIAVDQRIGIYAGPPARSETLHSNLLAVKRLPHTLYIADTECRTPSDVRARASTHPQKLGDAWILADRRIISFLDLRDDAWDGARDKGTIEDFSVKEWEPPGADPQHQRHLVDLLNRALRQTLWPEVRYDTRHSIYYFTASRGLTPKKIRRQSARDSRGRTVFDCYRGPNGRLLYCRHSAFSGLFTKLSDSWFLELTPTYRFTSDGWNDDPLGGLHLKTIKEFQRNQAVFAEVRMWADYLGREADMFNRGNGALLEFGRLLEFPVEFGIDDEAWRKARPKTANREENQSPDLWAVDENRTS